MADLSSMSDDDLRAAYAQSDVSKLSDDDLKSQYSKALSAEPLPAVDDYGRQVPGSSPEMDHYIANSGIGKVLDAVGHGAKQAWGTSEIVEPDTADLLKKAGVLPDVESGQTGIIRGYNEALLRPAAAGLDMAIRAGGQVLRGLSAGAAGVLAGAAEAGTQIGGEAVGRGVGEVGEFLMTDAGSRMPMHPLDLETARTQGVLGTEAEWKGVSPPTEDFPAGSVTHYSAPAAATTEGDAMKPYAPTLSPDVQAMTEPPVTEPAAPTNVHEAARAIAPDTFDEYDSLSDGRDSIRTQIATAQDSLRRQAEAQAPHASEIADLESRLQSTTPRLAKKYQARLDELIPQRDAFLADDFTMSALTRDTPEVASMRQQLQEIDYRMRDLAPDVTAAYREASKQFPEVAEAAPEPAPEPSPTPPASEAQERPATAPEAVASAPAARAPEPTLLGGNPPAAEPPRVNIAEDVSRKLLAAGRPAEEAQAAGAVQEAMWRTRAAAFEGKKGTAEAMYAREAPDIRAGRDVGAPQRALELAQKGRDLAQQAQGKIRLTDDGRAVITLFKSANASTFLHETGHDWLERMVRDAHDPDAPTRMATDADTVRKYLGNDGGDLTTKQHEKFARSFERYFMEGRAPSAGLARVFEQFKNWLTTIYQTVARLRAPITDDIRDVFDRLLSTNPERPTIAPDTAADAREMSGHAEPLTPYADVPREPKRLINFLRESVTHGEGVNATRLPGGLRDPNGDVSAIVGGPKGRPGLINKNGQHLDDATLKAWEGGYFPEHDQRPEINHLLDAIREDHNGNPRYSMHDQEAVDAYNHAMEQNAEVDRLASQYGVDPTGLTRDQFFDKITEKETVEHVAEEIRNMEDNGFSDLDAEVRDISEPPFYGISEPRSLEDLENEARQADSARSTQQGADRDAGSGHADGPAGDGEVGGRQDGRSDGSAGSAGAEAGKPGSGGSGDSGSAGPGGSESVSDGGPEREPKLPPIDVKTEPQDFRTKEDREIEKAANIRLDKINGTEDMNAALRQLAEQNGDFMDARYGTPAYQTQMDIRNTRILLRGATSDMMQAAAKAAGGDPAAIADWVTKQQRAAMVFDRLSTLSADWAHAGHELNKVMEGWGEAKNLARNIQDTTGKTLFQLQQQAAAMAAMPTAEQAGKFASDLAKSWGDKAKDVTLSLFINNLISGPITHMAYMTGNAMMSLYRAVPETTMQAVSGALRSAVSAEPIADRVYFREVAPQLYGMFKGARDGIAPALRALKTGIPELAGGAQAELSIFQNTRQQVIPGAVGRVLETPSRAVAALHTFSYSMSYSQEIGRLAARDAAARGLMGDAFNAEVARLTSSPTPQMMEAASDAGMHGTLMTRPTEGGLQQWLVEGTNKFFAFKLAVPFMQIGSNILKEGVIDRTSLSLLSGEARAEAMGLRGGAARDIRFGKITAGSMLGAATVGMAMEGMITGGGPADPNKRRVLEASGWSPYSIKVGDTYYPYRKFLGPMGPLVAASSDMYEIGHSLSQDGLVQAATSLAFGFSEVVASETWMSGIANLVEAAHDPGSKGEQYLRSMATSFIPFSVGMAQVARMVDPYQRRAQTILDAARNKIPFASEGLEPQIGIWGQPIGSHTMVSPTSAANDPVDDRLRALGIGVTALERKITGIPLTDQQYTQFARTAGMLTHQRLTAMVTAPGFAQLPAGIQTKAIQETITKSRDTARALMKMQSPEIIQRATQNKLDLRTNGRGGAY